MGRRSHPRLVTSTQDVTSDEVEREARAESPKVLQTGDGGRAELVGSAIEFRDPQGRLLVRYDGGALELCPASGDLRLRAPAGRIQLEAAIDVSVKAARDFTVTAARSAHVEVTSSKIADLPSRLQLDIEGAKLTGAALDLRARVTKMVTSRIDTIASEVRTSAKTIETTARKVETTAERITTKAKDVVEDVAGLMESRIGRVRSLVRGAFSLRTKTVQMKSEEDTSIDGRRVLLG
jgi:hypothetical protein